MRKVTATTPAGSRITMEEVTEPAGHRGSGLRWVRSTIVNEHGRTTGDQLQSFNVAWAMAMAYGAFFTEPVGGDAKIEVEDI